MLKYTGKMLTPKGVAELFPDAKIMICGGHAGRAHMKQLQKLAKKNYSQKT